MSRPIARIVQCPSVDALAFQAYLFEEELQAITPPDYSREACTLRELFFEISKHIRVQLDGLRDGLYGNDDEDALNRAMALGEILHRLTGSVSALYEASPTSSPPALQAVITNLARSYLEDAAPLCILQPQWEYNWSYMPLSAYLEKVLSPTTLDPDNSSIAKDPTKILEALWPARGDAYRSLAVIRFARLDSHDTLLFPVLAHEVGHFIDFTRSPEHLDSGVRQHLANITTWGLSNAIDTGDLAVIKYMQAIAERCMRELIADQLATRMMGLGFFMAQSELLKSLSSWNQPPLLTEYKGYPGLRFRLRAAFQQLQTQEAYKALVGAAAEGGAPAHTAKRRWLLEYLREWEAAVSTPLAPQRTNATFEGQLEAFVAEEVQRALPAIHSLAAHHVPDEKCPQLPYLFERVDMLRRDIPPYCAGDNSASIPVIAASGWIYQLMYGDERERRQKPREKFTDPAHKRRALLGAQCAEYQKTCRLLLKALELLTA